MTERTAPECGCVTTGKIVRGMCATHYDRWVHKTPKSERDTAPRFSRQFWDYVDKSGACWLWAGTVNAKGYGFWSGEGVDGRRGLAHRLSLAEMVPCPDEALFACHRCDNPPCVNPRHLYWGTVRDNTDDMLARGRVHNKGRFAATCKRGHAIEGDNLRIVAGRRMCRTCDNKRSRDRQAALRAKNPAKVRVPVSGERHGMARLTWEAVRSIRRAHSAGEPAMALAREYGISEAHVWRILSNKSWREEGAADGVA